MQYHQISFIREDRLVQVEAGTSLLQAQIDAGLQPDAPCGGHGSCGKCVVEIRRSEQEPWQAVRACRTAVDADLEVRTPLPAQRAQILTDSLCASELALAPNAALAMCARLRQETSGLLALGAGSCTRCKQCSYPDAPCRFPERMTSSMEACGMLVLQVCKDNGLTYYYGPNTIAYTSCFLLKE